MSSEVMDQVHALARCTDDTKTLSFTQRAGVPIDDVKDYELYIPDIGNNDSNDDKGDDDTTNGDDPAHTGSREIAGVRSA
jgi:hypothetical protein